MGAVYEKFIFRLLPTLINASLTRIVRLVKINMVEYLVTMNFYRYCLELAKTLNSLNFFLSSLDANFSSMLLLNPYLNKSSWFIEM